MIYAKRCRESNDILLINYTVYSFHDTHNLWTRSLLLPGLTRLNPGLYQTVLFSANYKWC